MQIFKASNEVESSTLPPETKAVALETVVILEEIFGQGFDSSRYGYIVFIEQDDTPTTVMDHHGRLLFQQSIEGVFTRHGCLLAVTLWGNSGDGITWICPDLDDYAPEVRSKLKAELAASEGGQGGTDQP